MGIYDIAVRLVHLVEHSVSITASQVRSLVVSVWDDTVCQVQGTFLSENLL